MICIVEKTRVRVVVYFLGISVIKEIIDIIIKNIYLNIFKHDNDNNCIVNIIFYKTCTISVVFHG